MEPNDRVVVLDHPIVQHKLAILRDKRHPLQRVPRCSCASSPLFEAYEATRDLPLDERVHPNAHLRAFDAKQITRPARWPSCPSCARASAWWTGVLELIRRARVGHLGMHRDEETHEPARAITTSCPATSRSRRVLRARSHARHRRLGRGGRQVPARGGRAGTIQLMVPRGSAPEGIERRARRRR